MSYHVKIFARCDFSLWPRQRHKTWCLPWHPLLALGSSFSHHHWPWNGIAYCELPSEPSIVVISVIQSLRASLKKRHAYVLAACKFITANQSKPEGRSHLGQQQQQFSTIEWTWDVVWNVIVAISECAQASGRQCCRLRGWCALRLSLTSYSISYGKMYLMLC